MFTAGTVMGRGATSGAAGPGGTKLELELAAMAVARRGGEGRRKGEGRRILEA